MTRKPDDAPLAEALGRALHDGLDRPVDVARLTAGARAGAVRVRRRRRAGAAGAGVLALAAVPLGAGVLTGPPADPQVAARPAATASPPPDALVAPSPAPSPAPSLLPSPMPSLDRRDGRLVVPDEAMLDAATVREVVADADAGTFGSWTADSATTGWAARVPCSDGPDAEETAATEGLRERGSDDGQGVTVYTSVAVYPPGAAQTALDQVTGAVEDGTCEGGLVTEWVPETTAATDHPGPSLVARSDDGSIALAVRGQDDVVVSVRVFSAAGRQPALSAATDLLDAAVQRLHDSGYLAAVQAERAG